MKKLKSIIGLSLAAALPMTAGLVGVNHFNFNKNLKITNGVNVKIGTAPWFCTINSSLDPGAAGGGLGGVLINSKWVLSCAHDVDDIPFVPNSKAVLRFNTYNNNYLHYSTVISRESSKIIIDPLYAQHGSIDYDLSLIKLNKPINNIPSVTLPKKNVNIGDNVTVYGYGISGQSGQKVFHPKHLQKADINVDNPNVNKPWKAFDHFNPKNEILAGPLNGKRIGAALGDSGGPLVKFINNKTVIEGIVSRGVVPYSAGWIKAYPCIYSDVYANLHWIMQTIKNG